MQAVPSSVCKGSFCRNHAMSTDEKKEVISPETKSWSHIPKADSESHIPKTQFTALKKLKEYTIVALKVIATIIILPAACVLSIPAAFIRLQIEIFINRRKHYNKYHPCTHSFNHEATLRDKKKICAELRKYCDYIIPKLSKLIDPENISKTNRALIDSTNPGIRNQLHQLKSNLDEKAHQLHRAYVNLYRNKELREIEPEKNKKIADLLNQISEAHGQLDQACSLIPENQFGKATYKNDKLVTELDFLRDLSRQYQQDIICPYCCPICSSDVAETTPHFLRAFSFVLPLTPYLTCLSFIGAHRTAELVLFKIWGTEKPINYFPWHPGAAHRFPFATSERKGIEALDSAG